MDIYCISLFKPKNKKMDATHFKIQYNRKDEYKDKENESTNMTAMPLSYLPGNIETFKDLISLQIIAIFKIKYK